MSKESKRIADAIKPALSNALTAQCYAALIAIPGFGWLFSLPIVSHVTKAVLDKIAEWMVQETAVGLSILWIAVDLAYEVNSVESATKRLNDMLNNPKEYSAKEQAEIEGHFDKAAVDIINLSVQRL